MSKIQVLDPKVAELIAAGEVVERPASVIKELMENAIDAGATALTVEIKNGGVKQMRVVDNGSGIEREDVETAFVRHATSKVRSADDLERIGTLGFRGEALASIAAVSRVTLLTRTQQELAGSCYQIDGSGNRSLTDAGCPKGTSITVEDLFYNVPARMKFLKKDISEGNAVANVVDKIALSHPEISIRFVKDGKQELFTPGDGKLLSCIYAVYGRDFSSGMIQVDYADHGISVRGYICKPLAARANRSMQNFFINGRYVRSRTAQVALEQAYRNAIMVGKFPSCVLEIGLENSAVDVNVHPAKIEVRFVNEKPVFDAVYFAVKSALLTSDERPQLDLAPQRAQTFAEHAIEGDQLSLKTVQEKKEEPTVYLPPKKSNQQPFFQEISAREFSEQLMRAAKEEKQTDVLHSELSFVIPPRERGKDRFDQYANCSAFQQETEVQRLPQREETSAAEAAGEEKQIEDKAGIQPISARAIGEVFGTYLLAEAGDELLLIDKHAAHERILFEQLKAGEKSFERQVLLSPLTITPSKEEYGALIENSKLVEKLGFLIEDFGSGTVLVREAATIFERTEIEGALLEIAEGLQRQGRDLTPKAVDDLYHSVACRAAIKAHDKTSDFERQQFVDRVCSDAGLRYCPHGRPIMITLSRQQLEKRFGRIQ